MQPIRVNRLLNKISNLINKAVSAASARINLMPGAAQGDVRSGEEIEDARQSLTDAYDILRAEIDDSLTDLDQQLIDAQDAIEEQDFDSEPLPDWAREALEDFPFLTGRLATDADCPDGKSHDSPIFGSISEVADWVQPIGSFWVVNSPNDGRSFIVTVCDAS